MDRVVRIAYNVVWWIPVALPVVGLTSYRTGLIWFLAISIARALVNLYRNNAMPVEKAQYFPLRLP